MVAGLEPEDLEPEDFDSEALAPEGLDSADLDSVVLGFDSDELDPLSPEEGDLSLELELESELELLEELLAASRLSVR